jgi:Family of unknown function (DUF6600)
MRGFIRSFATAFVLFIAGAASSALADPPARVGRLSLIEGDVTFTDTATRESSPATLNWPVTGGAALATAPGAHAEVRIGSTAVRLDGATALEFTQVDDQVIRLRLDYGAATLRVRSREVAGEIVLETRDARIGLSDAGRYRVDAGRAPDTTAITVFEGAARVDANGMAFAVQPGRRAEVGSGRARVVEAFTDDFDGWALALDRRDDAARDAPRYVSPETTGYESLDAYGDWRATPEYGAVWYPRAVLGGWAPYRAGRWAWIEPWGWTWIDEAPWGFAPFHYGRWALVGGAWGWVPGAVVARPVYAPALVGWIGRPGWSVSVTIGSVPAVGWFPLAPREVFVPAYRTSPTYVRNVNVAHVTNVTNIVNVTNVTQTRYAYRQVERAVTVVPAAAVTGGGSVERSAVRVRHADLVADGSGTNAPPTSAARPPRQFGSPRRDDDGRWLRRPEATSAPAAAAGADQPRPRSEPERRPEPRVDRERPAPAQAPPAVTSPAPPVAAEREGRRNGPERRPEPRAEREGPAPVRASVASTAPTQSVPAVTSPAPPAPVVAPAQPRVAAPVQPRVAAPESPRERAERHDERRAAPAAQAPAPIPAPAAVARPPAPMPAPAAVARPPAPMPPPAAVARPAAPAPSIAHPQAAPGEGRAQRPDGNRGQQREARQGERRGG